MTVKDLRDALAGVPDDAQVIVTGLYSSSTDDIEVKIKTENRPCCRECEADREPHTVVYLETDLCTG